METLRPGKKIAWWPRLSLEGGAGSQIAGDYEAFQVKVRLGNVLPTSRRQSQASSAGKMPAARYKTSRQVPRQKRCCQTCVDSIVRA
jgi:hypothetical protein